MYPTREKAREILFEAEPHNPGPWVAHCITTAECAEKIAALCGMNPEKAYSLGLLHDIGRRFGKGHFRHVVDGYRYMSELGFDEAARICLTHSFSTKNMSDYIGNFDVSGEELAEMEQALNEIEFDDYDRLMQLCDTFAGAGQVMSMKDRMDDVERRYGSYPKDKRDSKMALKAYFEKACGENIYIVIGADQSLWGL